MIIISMLIDMVSERKFAIKSGSKNNTHNFFQFRREHIHELQFYTSWLICLGNVFQVMGKISQMCSCYNGKFSKMNGGITDFDLVVKINTTWFLVQRENFN